MACCRLLSFIFEVGVGALLCGDICRPGWDSEEFRRLLHAAAVDPVGRRVLGVPRHLAGRARAAKRGDEAVATRVWGDVVISFHVFA